PSPSSPSTSLFPTTASATAYSSPASKSLTKSSPTNRPFTHSQSPPSFHRTRYSTFPPLPLFSKTSSTSANSNIPSSKTFTTLSSPNLLPNCRGFPFGVTCRISFAKANGVSPLLSSTSGSAPRSSSVFTTPGLMYPAAMCSAVSPPVLSL
ncbi:hypothetical protein LINPERHAP1_LOCUS11741, partial [Linum perenne]